ncbi:MAG TPA: hypothetical protein GX707_20560 [Epulopiscium sp.]|nr:hypothetical protein [Candidatus Epulonipiscium sp.]
MSKFFSNNIVWKTASLISALILWVFVINTANPPQSYDMKNRTISLRGADLLENKGYVIKNETALREQKVRVVVKGPRLQIEKIRSNPELIDIKVDITKYVNNISTNMDMVAPIVPIDVNVPLGLTIVEQSPKNLEVIFEREKTVTKKIEYVINGGSNKEYETLTPKIVPETIEVWGAESYMDEIDTVRIDIDVENFSEDVLTYEIPIKIYNVEGIELTELKKSHTNAEVTLPIGKKKIVPLEMQFVGALPEGFIQTSVGVYPKTITIIGKPTLIDSITSIKLDKVSLENIIETSKITTKFILPPGVSYLDHIENSATITIQVKEQSIYDYRLDLAKAKVNIINQQGDFDYEMLDSEITVKVKSIAENLLNVSSRDIVVTIDMQGYSQGEYEIPITLEFPPEVLVVENPLISIKITEKIIEPELDPELELDLGPYPEPNAQAEE